jgi:hypothetical protein
VLGAQLPKTAGIYMQVLYRHLDFGCPAWECWIEAISGLRQRALVDNSVHAVRTLAETHRTHEPPSHMAVAAPGKVLVTPSGAELYASRTCNIRAARSQVSAQVVPRAKPSRELRPRPLARLPSCGPRERAKHCQSRDSMRPRYCGRRCTATRDERTRPG